MEEWKDIRGYEGLYQVSNEGRVRSLERIVESKNRYNSFTKLSKGEILTLRKGKGGHLSVILSKNGVDDGQQIHVLVATAFIPNPHGYDCVHHKDHDPSNNRVENLEWINRGEHSKLHNSKRVDQIDKVTSEVLHQWNSTMDILREMGYNHSNISQCCLGKRKTANGYVWKYVSENNIDTI